MCVGEGGEVRWSLKVLFGRLGGHWPMMSGLVSLHDSVGSRVRPACLVCYSCSRIGVFFTISKDGQRTLEYGNSYIT